MTAIPAPLEAIDETSETPASAGTPVDGPVFIIGSTLLGADPSPNVGELL